MVDTPKKVGRPAKPNPVLQALEGISTQIKDVTARVAALEQIPGRKTFDSASAKPENTGAPGMPANSMGKVNWTSGIQGNPTSAPAGSSQVTKKELMGNEIPADFISEKNRILGEDFGMKIEVASDEPVMEISIIVPEEKSNMSPDQRSMVHADVRTQKITYAEGINGFRTFLEGIRLNLKLNAPVGRPVANV